MARTLEEFSADHLNDKIEQIALQLERLANDIRRHPVDLPRQIELRISDHPYQTMVSRVQHDVLWGLANLNIDSLLQTAIDAETGRTEASHG